MPACENQIPLLVDAASGELPTHLARDLDAHLATCPGCTAELESMRGVEHALQATAHRPDDFLLSGFAVRVADRAVAFRERSPRGLLWGLTRAMRFTLAFSSMSAALALALFVQSRQSIVKPPVAPKGPEVAMNSPMVDGDEGDGDVADDVDDAFDGTDRAEYVSLDSALDSLTADELDELADQISSNAG